MKNIYIPPGFPEFVAVPFGRRGIGRRGVTGLNYRWGRAGSQVR